MCHCFCHTLQGEHLCFILNIQLFIVKTRRDMCFRPLWMNVMDAAEPEIMRGPAGFGKISIRRNAKSIFPFFFAQNMVYWR